MFPDLNCIDVCLKNESSCGPKELKVHEDVTASDHTSIHLKINHSIPLMNYPSLMLVKTLLQNVRSMYKNVWLVIHIINLL